MACCMTGHAQTGEAIIQAEAPPCHGTMKSETAAPMSKDTTADSPGCADCETAMLASKTADQSTVLTSADDFQLLPVEVNRWTGYETPRILRTTGPPRVTTGLPTSTPISLKQRLLV